jgi:hypothetical protein
MAAMNERRAFYLDMDVKALSVDGDGTLNLRGYAACFSTDRDREVIQRSAAEAAIERYMANPVLILNHDITKPIGKVLKASVDDFGILVDAVVPRPVQDWAVEAYEKIRDGIYKAFSVGGLFGYQGKSVVHMDWAETSVCAVPAHPNALFALVTKSFDVRAETPRELFAALDSDAEGDETDTDTDTDTEETIETLTDEQFDAVMEQVKSLRTKAAVFVEATEQQGVRIQTAKALRLRKKASALTTMAASLEKNLQRLRAGTPAPPNVPGPVAAPGRVSPLKSPLGHAHGEVYGKPVPRSASGLVQIMGEAPGTYCKGGTRVGYDNDLRRACIAAGYTSDIAKGIKDSTKKRLGSREADITSEHIKQQQQFGEV